jgi:hypothetical protein
MYRIDNSKKYGFLLWMDVPCGIKQPLIRWASLDELRHFANNLIEYCNYVEAQLNNGEKDNEDDNAAIESMLRQVFGDENGDNS